MSDFVFVTLADAQKTGTCPCGSGKRPAECCQPILQGKAKASTAEALMRARYTAFATGDIDFIFNSHHPKTSEGLERKEIEAWSKSSTWLGLRVIETQKGATEDSEGVVIFHARYHAEGKDHDHYEHSQFERHQGDWKFLDAQPLHTGPVRREGPKIGRNDPCHCGSGQKFKKCHGR
jgi:SEC-C motif-containing protein